MNEKEKKYYKLLGISIQILRAAHALTQEDLAYMLGISRIAVSMIEAGKQKISLHIYGMFTEIFNSNIMIEPFSPIHSKEELLKLRKEQALKKLNDRY